MGGPITDPVDHTFAFCSRSFPPSLLPGASYKGGLNRQGADFQVLIMNLHIPEANAAYLPNDLANLVRQSLRRNLPLRHGGFTPKLHRSCA